MDLKADLMGGLMSLPQLVTAFSKDLLHRVSELPLASRIFASLVFGWSLIMFFIGLIGTLGALWQYRRTPPPRLSSKDPGLPGVTVLRPLKGLDANLEENLLSVLNQEYPPEKLEVIISVASPMDPAVPLARSLAKTYRNCTLHIGESPLGRNPKVRNLAQPFKQAKHDLIWTMDSNVSLSSPGTLLRAIERFQAGAGLVHHLPVALLPSTNCLSGALLESAFLGTAHAKLYTFFNTLGFASCVIGKSHFYSRSVLEGLTDGKGIECFRDNLAEDNSVAKLLWGAGFSHAMTPDLALQSLSPAMRFRDYWTRRLRWIRIRKHTEPAATLLEPLTESVFLGALLGVACVMVGFDWKNVLLWYFGIWALEDLAIALWLGFAGLPQAKWKLLLAYLVRELLAFPLWVAGVSGSSIDWRGKRFRVGRGGEAVPLDLDDDSVVEPREANGHLNGTELANGMNGHAGNGIKARLRKR